MSLLGKETGSNLVDHVTEMFLLKHLKTFRKLGGGGVFSDIQHGQSAPASDSSSNLVSWVSEISAEFNLYHILI
jgi:hypothetical protein